MLILWVDIQSIHEVLFCYNRDMSSSDENSLERPEYQLKCAVY